MLVYEMPAIPQLVHVNLRRKGQQDIGLVNPASHLVGWHLLVVHVHIPAAILCARRAPYHNERSFFSYLLSNQATILCFQQVPPTAVAICPQVIRRARN